MPVYEFLCRNCRKTFEVVTSVSEFDPKRTKCPRCKSKKVERVWSRVYAITSKKS